MTFTDAFSATVRGRSTKPGLAWRMLGFADWVVSEYAECG